MEWWEWLMIVAVAVWIFTYRGFSGSGKPSDPPFPNAWTKLGTYLRKLFGGV